MPTTCWSLPKCFVMLVIERLVMLSLWYFPLFGLLPGIFLFNGHCWVDIHVSRCGVYPSWILYSPLYDAAWFIEFFPAYYIFNSLLVTLQLLHILWTYFLFKVRYKMISSLSFLFLTKSVLKLKVPNSINRMNVL